MSTFYPVAPLKEQVALLQRASVAADAVSSQALTLTRTPRVGSVLVALISLASATVTLTSIAQTGVTWSAWMSKSGTGVGAIAWLGVVTGSASKTLTVSLSATTSISVEVSEWSGLNTSALTLATGAGNSGTGQVADSGTVAPTPLTTPSGAKLNPQGLVITLLAAAAASTTGVAGPGLNQFSGATGSGTATITSAGSWFDQVPPAPTYEYWVSASGQDTNPGTKALPFYGLNKLSSLVNSLDLTGSSGVLIHIAGGVYNWDFGQRGYFNNLTSSATAPIRIVSDAPGKTIIHSNFSPLYTNATPNVVVDGLTFDGTGTSGGGTGLTLNMDGPYGLVQDCVWRNYSAGSIEAIAQGNTPRTGHHLVIRRCIAYNLQGVTSGTSNSGLFQLFAPYCQVTNCLLVKVSFNGIWLSGSASQCIITNNTICNVSTLTGVTPSGNGIVLGASDAGVTSDYHIVANNIIRDCATGIREYVSGTAVMGTHSLYLNNDTYNCTTNYALLNGLTPSGGITTDPLFVNYVNDGSGDYHLTASSPCIDTGTSACAPDVDLDGNVRPTGAGYDIGAYEYAAQPGDTQRGVWSLGATGVNWAAVIGILAPLTQPPSSGFNGYYRAITREEGATAYFRMNEPIGALSIADNALPGAYVGNPSATGVVMGYGGMLASDPAGAGAALFDGATGAVTTTYTPGSLSAFSARAWLAWDGIAATGSHPRIFSTDVVATDHAGFELYLTPGGGSPTLSATASTGAATATVTSSANVPWLYTRTQVFMTYDGALLKLYINGALVGSSALTGSVAAALHSLRIGADPSGANYFAGLLQDIAVFEGVALSAAQVQADYIAGVRGPATQQSAASQYGFKQQLVLVYAPSGAFADVWRDAPLLAGVKYALNSATTPIRVQLPRAFDNFDEVGAPNSRGSIGQGNIVQYWIFGPGLPTGGVLKYQGVIDAYAPAIAENGEESVTVTITPFDSSVGDNGLLGDVTFGNPNNSATYVDPVTIFNYWFSTLDPLTGKPYTYPLALDPNNPTSSGNLVQYTFTSQALSSVFNTITQMLPANWYWRVNGDKTVTLNVPPVTAQHLFVIGQHIVSPTYKKDWTRLKNVINVVGTGVSVSLATAITSGASVSALAVSTTPIAIPSGTAIILNDGGNPTQTFTVSANVSAGATSIPVYSSTANASYSVSTIVTLPISSTVNGSDYATFGKRVMQLADNRVTDVNTANILANGLLTQYDQMILRTKIRVIDYRGDANWGLGYDIETIQPGDTCQIINPSNTGNALSQVAIIYGLTYGFDYVDLELGYFIPEDSRDLNVLRSQFQDFTLGR